jgi:hypothetical protein
MLGLLSAVAPGLSAQGGGFTPGTRELFSVDFAAEPLGEFPKSLRLLQGTMDMVEHFGQRMLKASDRAEFLINLPEVMPQDFTLEFDLVPKECCQPHDLSFEGTRSINQDKTSAHVMWKREALMVVGGSDGNVDTPMPPDLANKLPGELVEIRVSVDGGTLKMFTNGREVLNLTNRAFVRSRVLRVFLGGQNDRDQAVYLAKLRIATNSPKPGPRP